MEQRIYRGSTDPNALAQHVLDTWDQGDTVAQALEGDEGSIVQVGYRTGGFFNDEPQNALTLALEPVSDGLRVSLGEQQWYRDQGGQIMVGGLIGFFPFFFTWPLSGGRDEPVDPQLAMQVWESIEGYIGQSGASQSDIRQLSQRPIAATVVSSGLRHALVYCLVGPLRTDLGKRCPGLPNSKSRWSVSGWPVSRATSLTH
jgi:hypothetical protein